MCEPYSLHDLAHISWVGSVLCISCTASHNAGEELDDVDHDLSSVSCPRFETIASTAVNDNESSDRPF